MSEDTLVQTVSMETDDFEELQESAEGWDQQYTQLSPGPFTGTLDMRLIGSRQIFREYYGRKLQYQGTAPAGGFGFALSMDQPSDSNFVGETVTDDTAILQAPGQEANFVGSDYWDVIVLGVSEREVRRISSALSDHDGLDSHHHGTVTFRPEVANCLRNEGRRFLELSKDAPAADHARLAKWSEQYVKQFIWHVVEAQSEADKDGAVTQTAVLVRKATDLAMSSPEKIIGLVEICEFLDVSLRTLHYAFNDVTGMSPANWLRVTRLNRIHKTLKNAGPDDLLVKQVALDNGFFHLGHFSKQYKRHFHCFPSETLQSA